MPAHQMEAPSPRAHHLRQSKKNMFDGGDYPPFSSAPPPAHAHEAPPRQVSPSPFQRGRTNPLARALASRRRDRWKGAGAGGGDNAMLGLSPSRRRLIEEAEEAEENKENIRVNKEAGRKMSKNENDARLPRKEAAAFSSLIETSSRSNQQGCMDAMNAGPAPTQYQHHHREHAAVALFSSQTMSTGSREKNMDGISSKKYLPSPRETAATIRATTLTARATTQSPEGATSATMHDPRATTQTPAAAAPAMNDSRAMTQTPTGATSTTNDPSATIRRPAGAGEAASATRPTTPVEVTTRFKTFSSLGKQNNMCHKFVRSQSGCSDATITPAMDSRSDASSNILESLINASSSMAQHTGGGAQNLRLPPGAVEKLRSAQSISHNANLMSPRSTGGGIPGSSPRAPAAFPSSSSPRRRNNGGPILSFSTLASRNPTSTRTTTRTTLGPSPRAQAQIATLLDGTPLITPLPPLRASCIDGPSLRYNATLSIGMQKDWYLKLLESQFTEGLRALKEQFEFHVSAIKDQRDRQERHYFLQIDKEIDRLVQKLQRDYEVEIMQRRHDHEELIQQNDQEAAHLMCEYEQTMAEQKLEETQHVFLSKHAQKRKMMELQLPMQAAQSPVPLSPINSQRRNLPQISDSQGSLLAPPGDMAQWSTTPSRNTPNAQANGGLATPQSLLALPSAGSSCSRSVSPSRLKPARLQPVLLPAISSPRNRSISPAPARQCLTPMNQGGFTAGRPPTNRSFGPHVRSLTPQRAMAPTARDVVVAGKTVNAQSANLASRRPNLLSPSTSRFCV